MVVFIFTLLYIFLDYIFLRILNNNYNKENILTKFQTFVLNNFLEKEIFECMKINNTGFIFEKDSRQQEMQRIKKFIKLNYPLNYSKHCYCGYCGPWIEEIWIKKFSDYNADKFGLFVPIFASWLYLRKHNKLLYIKFLKRFFATLKPEYLYFTVTQHDDGLVGFLNIQIPSNIFIASAGGRGHIPLLLLGQPYSPISIPKEFKYDVAFMGTLENHKIRKFVNSILTYTFGERFYSGSGSNWKQIFSESKAILCPRGVGRNSFRLTETLQMGLIPIYIYDDYCWIPYYNSIGWDSIGFSARVDMHNNISEINRIISFVRTLNQSKIIKMRQKISSLYSSHFSVEGLFKQLEKFLYFGFSSCDLRCAKLYC